MVAVGKIDSNVVGLRFAEEQSFGILPGSPIWEPLDPNSFADFGGQVEKVARSPIEPSRQRKKGVLVDLDASGGFNLDFTQENVQKLLQGFFFADLRKKVELSVAVVDGTNEDFEPTSGGDGYFANDLIFAKGFTDAANNGLHRVTAAVAASVTVASNLVTAAGQTGIISRVGFQFASGDATISAPGGSTLPSLNATAKNLTQLGLIVGEWVFIGGDAAVEQFATPANNCFARVRSITSAKIEFDKTSKDMVTDAGAGKTIRIFFGRVLKNETGTLIKRRTYNFERTLGAPDDAQPTQIQSEYLTGGVPNEVTFNFSQGDKVNADMTVVAAGFEQRTGVQGVKTGTRPALAEADAYNTSSDFSRLKLSTFVTGTPNPLALFAFIQEMKITVRNNVSPAKALAVLGAFEVTAGTFDVLGTMTAYFADVTAVQAVRNNTDVSLDLTMVRANQGVTIDIPLLTLGDGRPDVRKDEPITLPLSMDAATGAKIATSLDYTMLMVFWDFLPNLADT